MGKWERERERGVKDGRIPKVVEDGWDPKGSGGWVGYQGCGEQKGEIDAFPHKMLYFVNVWRNPSQKRSSMSYEMVYVNSNIVLDCVLLTIW